MFFSQRSELSDETALLMRCTITAYTSERQRLFYSFMDTRLGLRHTGHVENKLVIMVFVFPTSQCIPLIQGAASVHMLLCDLPTFQAQTLIMS